MGKIIHVVKDTSGTHKIACGGSANEAANVLMNDGTTVQKAVSDLQTADTTIISDVWNSSTTYEVGALVIYNNVLYKCLVQNSNVAPTNTTYWSATTLDDEIVTINQNLKTNSGASSLNSNVTINHFINPKGVKFAIVNVTVSEEVAKWTNIFELNASIVGTDLTFYDTTGANPIQSKYSGTKNYFRTMTYGIQAGTHTFIIG